MNLWAWDNIFFFFFRFPSYNGVREAVSLVDETVILGNHRTRETVIIEETVIHGDHRTREAVIIEEAVIIGNQLHERLL